VAGELHVISCNGGLLLLPAPAHQGSVVGLVFHTQQGTGGGHSTNAFAYQQHTAAESDQRTLHAAFQCGFYRNIDQEERIEELRAAVAKWNPSPPRGHFAAKLVMGLVAVVGCLACALYVHRLPR